MAELTYTVPEAAEAIGVSTRTLHRRIADGTFPVVRLGSRVLVSKAALAAWVETNSTTQQQHP